MHTKTKKFYLTGQNNFGNRGSEALTRATVKILKERFNDIEVSVPSNDIERDMKQWPDHKKSGVKFVPAYTPPLSKIWKAIQILPLPFVKKILWPLPIPKWHQEQIKNADAVIAIGGDNYSLDYFSLPGLLMAEDNIAMKAKKPVMLWGASLGPYKKNSELSSTMLKHLAKMSAITLRETLSYQYLKDMGLVDVKLVADPAFVIEKEQVDISAYWPKGGKKVVGINVSPLITKSKYKKDNINLIEEEITGFIRRLVNGKGYSVILIPHVVPLDGSLRNNDAHYMQNNILKITGNMGDMVSIAPATLNACQLKYVISKCDYFIGARTHSTIAALSSLIPTISIAYSTKAKGLNKDLLGNTDYVIDTSKLNESTLSELFNKLEKNEDVIKQHLANKIPEWQERARLNADYLAEIL